MRHIQRIDEFLSTPYDWRWTSTEANSWVAEFKTEDDKFWVEISKEGPFEDWELKFSSERRKFNGTDFKGPRGAMRVLITVFMDVMVAFFDVNPDATVKFYGSQSAHDKTIKQDPYDWTPADGNKFDTKRDRVYRMLMDGLPADLAWELDGRWIRVFKKGNANEAVFYHASNVFNRDSIKASGLDHKKGISPWSDDDPEFPKGNYLWSTEREAVKYAAGLGDSFDIWMVDTSDVQPDPITRGGFYTTRPIQKDAVSLVRTVKGVNESVKETFDLQKHFDDLNTKLFDGELKQVPLVWKTMRGSGGHLQTSVKSIRGRRIPDSEKVVHLAISDFYEKTEQQLLDTLAHEMVHLWIFQKGIRDDSYHGYEFRKKMKEINSKGLVSITLKDDVSDISIANKESLKAPVIVFVLKDRTRDKFLFALIAKKAFTSEAEKEILDSVTYTSKAGKRDFTVEFFDSVDPALRKYPVTVKYKKPHTLKYMELPAEGFQALGDVKSFHVKDGKIENNP